MMVRAGTQKCERVRAWISAELDGELSEFESLTLRSHLRGCEPCSTFRAEAASFTSALREAPLEPLSRPLVTPSRRRIAFQAVRVPAVAALAVAMIAFGGLFASIHSGSLVGRPSSSPAVAAFDDQDVRALQLQNYKAAVDALRLRRVQVEAARIPRHPGFQNP